MVDLESLFEEIIIAKGPKAIKKAQERLVDEYRKHKYGFSPLKEEAKELEIIRRSDIYVKLKKCIGNHWTLRLICLGIYLAKINATKGKEEKDKIYNRVKNEIKSRYNSKGLKITYIGSTGRTEWIVNYLCELEDKKNFKRKELINEFEEIIKNWEKITIFASLEITEDNLVMDIVNKMQSKHNVFFVFAYGAATKKAMSMISELKNNKTISNYGYLPYYEKNKDFSGSEIYCWTFELVKEYL